MEPTEKQPEEDSDKEDLGFGEMLIKEDAGEEEE